jgi:hypothetical protein
MKRINKTFYCIIAVAVILLTGCISKELQEAASVACATIDATHYSVSKGAQTKTGYGSFKSLNLEISGLDSVPADFPGQRLASVAAVVFIGKLKPEDYAGYSKVEMTLKRGNGEEEFLYDIKRLKNVENETVIIDSLLHVLKEKPGPMYADVVDTTVIGSELQWRLYDLFQRLDSVDGPITKRTYNGFRFGEKEETKQPYTTVWCTIKTENTTNRATFSVDETTNKVVGVGLNE